MADQLDQYTSTKTSSRPRIYAYSDINPEYEGCLKVGYTTIDVEKRVREQYSTKRPGKKPYNIDFNEPAFYLDGGVFNDRAIHNALMRMGKVMVRSEMGKTDKSEWFRCEPADVKAAWQAVRRREENLEARTEDFKMRPEQEAAVSKTFSYFESVKKESRKRIPKFLWNAKMRFGKTFAAYQLAKRMGAKKSSCSNL